MKTEEPKNDGLTKEETILLAEYNAAQNSAQHHDNLIWTVTSIIWTANVLLIGAVLGSINKDNLKWLSIALSLLGLILCLSVWRFTWQFHAIVDQKYGRCKEIENKFGVMEQQSKVKYSLGKQNKINTFIILLFVVIWGIILYVICAS
jgi:hypothetical protein